MAAIRSGMIELDSSKKKIMEACDGGYPLFQGFV
jgi:hypothetical protein